MQIVLVCLGQERMQIKPNDMAVNRDGPINEKPPDLSFLPASVLMMTLKWEVKNNGQ